MSKVNHVKKELRIETEGDDKSGINIGWSQIGNSNNISKKDIMSPVHVA